MCLSNCYQPLRIIHIRVCEQQPIYSLLHTCFNFFDCPDSRQPILWMIHYYIIPHTPPCSVSGTVSHPPVIIQNVHHTTLISFTSKNLLTFFSRFLRFWPFRPINSPLVFVSGSASVTIPCSSSVISLICNGCTRLRIKSNFSGVYSTTRIRFLNRYSNFLTTIPFFPMAFPDSPGRTTKVIVFNTSS